MPAKLAQLKDMFWIEAAKNDVLPIGGGLWVPDFHPELRIVPVQTMWEFGGPITRIPEFCAPAHGNKNNLVTIEASVDENASGVLYKLGGAGGGLTCYADDGYLCYAPSKSRRPTPNPAPCQALRVSVRHGRRPAGPGAP